MWTIIRSHYAHHRWIATGLVFAISLSIWTVWIRGDAFPDPDSFYHIAITKELLHDHRAVTSFPWLPYTTLNDHFVDHHLLYHLILAPFIALFGDVAGIKIATALLGATTVALFYWLLRVCAVRYPLIWTTVLLASPQFAFRLGLGKANAVSLIILLLGIAALHRRQLGWLLGLGFLYVWAYGGFILLPLVGILHLVSTVLLRFIGRKPLHWSLVSPVVVCLIGVAAGLIIHPSFPDNLYFYWEQLIQIGLINYGSQIAVGGEWYPLHIADLIVEPLLLSALVISGLLVFAASIHRQRIISWLALLLWVGSSLATLKSQRYIEYNLPFAALFGALSWTDSGWLQQVQRLKNKLQRQWKTDVLQRSAMLLLCTIPLGLGVGWLWHGATQSYHNLGLGIPYSRYTAATQWLNDYAHPGDIIVHSDWDDFPMLVWQAPQFRYIAGLDPTFFYRQNPDLYTQWTSITSGDKAVDAASIVRDSLQSTLVFVDADNQPMLDRFNSDPQFDRVFQDSHSSIFRLQP